MAAACCADRCLIGHMLDVLMLDLEEIHAIITPSGDTMFNKLKLSDNTV